MKESNKGTESEEGNKKTAANFVQVIIVIYCQSVLFLLSNF